VSITVYRRSIQDRLLNDPLIAHIQVIRERATAGDAHLRAHLTLADGSWLEFSEYARQMPDGQVRIVTYSYHWAEADGKLIRRWDNTPHFPDLPGAPHHVHDGASGTIAPGHPVSLFDVLDEIAAIID
jgi:hypothetical protein